jgi:hypothetical protein
LACCACALPAWAADVGVGVSAESNDSTIYVPIDFSNAWRVEPFVNYSKRKLSGGIKDDRLSIGAGLFRLQPLGESLRIYYGGRLAYLDLRRSLYTTSVATVGEDGDGYRIAPTLGFEYSFNDHISLGAEAAWVHEDIEWSFGDERRSGTDTQLILRFRF